jgi:hypothetical protein
VAQRVELLRCGRFARRLTRLLFLGHLHTSADTSMRQHTSAYVSIRQHTSAYVSIRSAPADSAAVSRPPADAGQRDSKAVVKQVKQSETCPVRQKQ